MAKSITDARQVTLRQFLQQITNASTYAGTADAKPANQAELDNLLAAINDELTPLLRMSASSTPNLIVSIGSAIVANSESAYQRSIPHIGALLPNTFTSGTVTFPASSGGTITVSPGINGTLTVASGNFIKVLIYMDSTGALNVLPGTESAVEANATVTAAPKSTLPLGYVTLQNVAGTIQPIAQNKIYQFGTGGGSGSGGSGSGVGDDLDALLFRASFTDKFDEGPTDAASAVDVTAGKTDSTAYSFAKAMYVLNYDASKTIAAATTTTNINISAVAAFTVKIGDMVIANNQARRITAVATQASFTTEAFSVAPTLASQVTISQAVHTKDIYNLPVDSVALSAAFSGATFQEVLMDYEDTSASGDAIFDVNTTPVVALSASADGTTYTNNKLRATLETDTMQSFALPAAGTGLFLRFFANKTSGSGTVNILGYRAFMQKSTIATAGGITNSSYAMSNGVGTPVNATLGISGGKTTITLPWSYATGVYSGTSASSIEVWLNGQKLPRFINSTLTPDGSFLETSANVVTLDRDYSSQALSIEIFQRTQIVDNSTTNTTNISYQQEVMQNGFQSFVNQNQLMNPTSNVGTPVAGSFYSAIIGRAPIPDLSQDLKVRMGIDRTANITIYQLQNEFGANGEIVSAIPNDIFGQVRFVGGWGPGVSSNGPNVSTVGINDFVEITFYGTGLNILANYGFTYDIRASVDGGSEGANLFPATSSGVLVSRGYSPNQMVPAVAGLSLGVHTVKLRNNNVNGLNFFGFEILNEVTTLKVNPGVSYLNGIKNVLASQVSPAHNATFEAGTLGSRGGRVVVYQKADGTIAKAVTPAGSQLNLASADHTNEEVVRAYHWREFGVARADDFSSLTSTLSTRAFTLDDGTTNLNGNNVRTATVASEGIEPTNGSGNYITLTFVGTGLDVEISTDTNTRQYDAILIDGSATVGVLSKSANTARETRKIVSGLPYGTHTVKFNMTGAASIDAPAIHKFIVYQPKKPTVPSGAVELADYNLMATYAANTTAGNDTVAAGILRKQGIREMAYVGTFSASQSTTGSVNGWLVVSLTNADYVEYSFWGTGFEYRYTLGGAADTMTVSVDGSTNLTGFTTSSYGAGASFTAATGVISAPSSATDFGATVSGLALGLHKVRVTKTSGAANWSTNAFDVITPIHSVKSNAYLDLQNTLTIGSTGISDNRKITPIKDAGLQRKNVSQAYGVASGPTTTSTTLVPMPDMSVVHSNQSGRIAISYSAVVYNASNGSPVNLQIYVDGIAQGTVKDMNAPVAGSYEFPIMDRIVLNVSPGTHKVDLFWGTNGTTGTAAGVKRNLLVEET